MRTVRKLIRPDSTTFTRYTTDITETTVSSQDHNQDSQDKQDTGLKLRPGMVLLKVSAEKVCHVSKHLSIEQCMFDESVSNIIWTPNETVVPSDGVFLEAIDVIVDDKTCYCDVTVFYDEDLTLGSKIVVLNGAQKSVIGAILDDVPVLHESLESLESYRKSKCDNNDKPTECADSSRCMDISSSGRTVDFILHPHSLKRLSMNFLYSDHSDNQRLLNDCFSYSPIDKLNSLTNVTNIYNNNDSSDINIVNKSPNTNNDCNNKGLIGDNSNSSRLGDTDNSKQQCKSSISSKSNKISKRSYYVSDRNGRAYVDKNLKPVTCILYESFVMVMGKQNPKYLLHAANEKTPINPVTGQPEVRYNLYINDNCHPFGISESERELCVGLGLNAFLEQMMDLSDPTQLTLENGDSEQVRVDASSSLGRTIDMLALAGVELDFTIS